MAASIRGMERRIADLSFVVGSQPLHLAETGPGVSGKQVSPRIGIPTKIIAANAQLAGERRRETC
ncbi:MAG: hypothetical protein MZV49_27200 [Rhodopseudomonas palustris]|nr:hypothetical protein [Rhodopseudomonas palustris]